jgi:exopolysaccharide biosynthesis polyprenyl glycosylphosphotransferase
MIQTRTRGVFLLLLGVHLLVALILYGALFLLFGTFYDTKIWNILDSYITCAALIAATIVIGSLSFNHDKLDLLEPGWTGAHMLAFRTTSQVLGVMLLFLFASKDEFYSRVFLFSYVALLYDGIFVTTRYATRPLARWAFQGSHVYRTLLAGTPDRAEKFRPWVERKEKIGLQTVGLITPSPASKQKGSFDILGTYREAGALITKHQISQVILLELPMDPGIMSEWRRICERHGTRLLIYNSLKEFLGWGFTPVADETLEFFALRREPLENPVNRILKRLTDMVLSFLVITFILPIATLIVWLAQRFQSPGPLLVRQERQGFQGHPFIMLKFRTMHPGDSNDVRQARPDDERIYPLGRWFRRLSLDELPQFINVLKGNMSIVGPRPHLVEHNQLFEQILGNYNVRSYIKPGITGFAQVQGFRGGTGEAGSLEKRVLADIHYVENWAFWSDILIILRTALQLLHPPSTAY